MANPYSKPNGRGARLCALFCFFFVLSAISVSYASDNTEAPAAAAFDSIEVTKERLEVIEKEIAALRQEINRLADQENSIISSLYRYDLQYQMNVHEIELLDLKQEKIQGDIEKLKEQYLEQERNLERQKAYLSHRLVEAYKLGELNYLKLMMQMNTGRDFLRSYQYVAYLARDDARRVQAYRDTIRQMDETRLRLEQEDRNLVRLKQDSEEAHLELLRTREEKRRLLAALQNQREMHLGALSELKVAANQLQKLFAVIDSPLDHTDSSNNNVSMKQYKGLLNWPVKGKVLREYGIQKHPKFGTSTMSNGIEISAEEGIDVHAVFAGQVVFSEWFKGYGQSIILSHPGGFYTLYAHNSELLVKRGELIERGQTVARVGATGSFSGPGLYFEIREKNQPVNPNDWLRRNLGSAQK